MAEDDLDLKNKKKTHRERNSGRKAEKKKSKKEAVNPVLEQTDRQRNPKAFAFNSAVRAERKFRRKQDIETKKQHVPLVDRTPIEPPPILIAVVGPPKVGKSTVINNLIRLFTRSPLTDIKGPVTIVTGKKRRITLIECNNDINSMIDIAKVADLVLLLCDASFGFEMEIFEFLNICQVHGMPRIMGILTHLDMIKNNKTLKNTKKILKHRFWTEVYAGAKLFYLSGIVHGEYLRNEIKNLGRFISIIKFRPLTWRSTHSYLLGDRIEDLTNQEFIRQNPKCDRTVSLYGYVRGVPLVKNTSVHIAGLGDLKISDISYLPDPCPLPDAIKKRALIEKEKFIYAPFSGVGGIVYDKDAVYVELGGSHSHKERTETEDESKNLMSNLIDTKQTLDFKLQHSEMQIFTGGKKLTAKDVKENTKSKNKSSVNINQKDAVDSDLDDELDQLRNTKERISEEKVEDSGRTRRRVIFEQDDEELSQNLKDNDNSDSDSENSDYDNETNQTEYTILRENKDKNIHELVSGALKYLDKKKPNNEVVLSENYISESNESESEESENESITLDSDDASLASHESLVGISEMKKKKDNIIDINDIQETDEESDDEETGNKKIKEESLLASDDMDFVDTEDELEANKVKNFESANESDDASVASHESLVGISEMKKKKDNIIDINNIQESDEDNDESDNEESGNEEIKEESSLENDDMDFVDTEDEFEANKVKNFESENESDDASLASHESLVGISEMKKKKDNIIDINDIQKTDEDDEESDDEESGNEEIKEESSLESDDMDFVDTEDEFEANKEKNFEERDSEELNNNPNDLFLDENEEKSGDEEDFGLKWKENLSIKARDAFLDRQKTTKNIMKLVYGVFDKHGFKTEETTEDKDREEIGGLFHLITHEQKRLKEDKEKLNIQESSLFNTWDLPTRDWLQQENKILIENCFVTGKWKDSEDAGELLRLDAMEIPSDDDSEVYGDFEDLETGEKHASENEKKRKRENPETEPLDKDALTEKKRKLKEKFDNEYDNGEKSTYYDDLKTSAEKQTQLNKSVFENMADDLRVQIEGFRAGMYVRIEFDNVPAEFIMNFDPTYPIVIGALNMGEENIGYVNVKIKKHRWHKKILKTNDPLIVSLGWRRFQTIPLYSKLEDDLKYRYLKYTPEHVQCNAHFWGPITPQGTGLLAIQSCNNDLDTIKRQGFRISATGSVQELEKSTQIMKKLKLIGYPLKIYKKTAFIKDMFNSALEVAKFEGARIKTVSGIRGQIKKAMSKPAGAFRATFEDKIQLSDIVFCRTWYKVSVPHFYSPVNTLLLPLDKKNAWQGARTTGQIKRDKGVQNEVNADNLYTEIQRQPRVFKPLIIPRKLQKILPYRDRPKFGPLSYDKKPDIEKKRVAVIREPHEQRVANMLKMLRTSYESKQEKLKAAMSERMARHAAMVQSEEAHKNQKQKVKRKEIFRSKSKKQIREEKKGGRK